MKRCFLFILLLMLISGCKVLFPTAIDPCPTPPEQHQDVWTPIKTAEGVIIGWTCIVK